MQSLKGIDFGAIARNEDRANELRRESYQYVIQDRPQSFLTDSRSNTKLRKSQLDRFRIVSLPLAHARESGHQVCAGSTAACRAMCVGSDSVGLAGVWPTIMRGRVRKTVAFFENRELSLVQLIGELHRETISAERNGETVCARLNVFSDLPWEQPAWGCIPQLFGDCIFYDYTKVHSRVMKAPTNYHLCGSWSENPRHKESCHDLLMQGKNVSVVFAEPGQHASNRALRQRIPERWKILGTEFHCFDGDRSDLRFLDDGPDDRGFGRICALRLKAGSNAVRDAAIGSGFVVVLSDL